LKRTLLLLIIFLMPALAGAALEAPVWVEATGEAIGSDFDPPREVVERARNDAKRKAVEQAVGTFIRSQTLVTNGQLAEDLIYARVQGKIDKAETLGEERDKIDPNLFRVKLRALVRPVYPEEGGIGVTLSLLPAALREGDEVKIQYQTTADCFVYIFSIGADNSVTLLFPNSQMTDNFVTARSRRVFPPENSGIHLQAMALPEFKASRSQEKVKIIATRGRETLLEGFQEGIFTVYDARSTGLVGDLARKLNQLDQADWGEALAAYTIEPRAAAR